MAKPNEAFSDASRPTPRPLSHAGLLVFVALVCAVVVGVEGFRLSDLRQATLGAAKRETANLARSLAQHAQDAIEGADAVLLGLRERAEAEGTGAPQLERLQRSMAAQGDALPLIRSVFFFDHTGESLVTSASAGPTGINYSDRTYFQHHAASANRGARVSGPFRSKTDGEWIMVLSRRVDRPDGGFAGVLLATMSAEVFQRFYSTFDVGLLGVVTLASADGDIIARRPHNERNIGRSLLDSELFRTQVSRFAAGTYEVTGGVDGLLRLGSFYHLHRYPLVVIVSRAKHEVLAEWRAQAWTEAGAVLAAALAMGALGWRIARQVRRRQRAEERYRLLADHSSDAILSTGADGRLRYVSPSFSAMTGWSPADAVGRDPRCFVHPEDRERYAAAFGVPPGGAESAVCSYRHARRDGSHVWVEERRRTAPPAGGAPDCVANLRDITERKSLEDRLKAANAELTQLSATDALTGLANRRRFDQALAAEWGRACRGGQPLSLVLLDADCFKAYNDLYGHPAGDGVLKTAASCIRAGLDRPADLAARYGGEEFAVLLPDTDIHGAVAVAERIRRAVETSGVPHAAAPSGFVSVSLGVASVVPSDRHPATLLVDHADAALYRAKRLGRNRVEAHAEGGAGPAEAPIPAVNPGRRQPEDRASFTVTAAA